VLQTANAGEVHVAVFAARAVVVVSAGHTARCVSRRSLPKPTPQVLLAKNPGQHVWQRSQSTSREALHCCSTYASQLCLERDVNDKWILFTELQRAKF
jgi:hypothetical protein